MSVKGNWFEDIASKIFEAEDSIWSYGGILIDIFKLVEPSSNLRIVIHPTYPTYFYPNILKMKYFNSPILSIITDGFSNTCSHNPNLTFVTHLNPSLSYPSKHFKHWLAEPKHSKHPALTLQGKHLPVGEFKYN